MIRSGCIGGVSAETQSKITSLEDISRELLGDRVYELEQEIQGDEDLVGGIVPKAETEAKRKKLAALKARLLAVT